MERLGEDKRGRCEGISGVIEARPALCGTFRDPCSPFRSLDLLLV